MPTVQIRNLDENAYSILRRRAAESGRSLQEYLRITLEREAQRQSVEEVLGAARAELTGEVSMDAILEAQREVREGRSGE
jgi:plasmid stability protein